MVIGWLAPAGLSGRLVFPSNNKAGTGCLWGAVESVFESMKALSVMINPGKVVLVFAVPRGALFPYP